MALDQTICRVEGAAISENARLIVQAVNSYDAMLEALEYIANVAGDERVQNATDRGTADILRRFARQAAASVKLARGE